MPRKTITANVSLPPEIHAWVKAKIAAILKAEPAANPTFTSVVSQALRRAMDEERSLRMAEHPDSNAAAVSLEARPSKGYAKKKGL